MKKLLGIFMLAVMVTVGSAFTAEKDVFDGPTLVKQGANWVPFTAPGPNCTGDEDACKITILTADVDASFYQQIGNAAGAASTYFVDIDHDEDPETEDLRVNVRVDARFPIEP